MKKLELDEWKERYNSALLAYDKVLEDIKKNKDQFAGKLMPDKGKETTCLYNFTTELIETSIDNSVPLPKVSPKIPTDNNVQLAKIIENMIKGVMKDLKFEEINDEDERTVKTLGGSFGIFEWDYNRKKPGVAFRLINPDSVIPQPGVYNIDYMDYIFVSLSDTKERLEERYRKEIISFDADDENNEDIFTQVTAYYKNSNGSVGCFSWTGDTVLMDEEEYTSRKVKICAKCGKAKIINRGMCECGSTEFMRKNKNYEELIKDITKSNGEVIPKEEYARDDFGEYMLKEVEEPAEEFNPLTGEYEPLLKQVFDDKMNPIGEEAIKETREQAYKEKTKIPYYKPNVFPVERLNITKEKSLMGVSDCELLRELQLNANKLSTRLIDKLYDGGRLLTKPKGLKINFNNGRQIIEIDSPEQKDQIGVMDLSVNVTPEVNMLNQIYYWAKSLLGVNDSFQGKADTTATSGRAKEVQVQRALGRQTSKVVMKQEFYKRIFRSIFEMMLAYSDEPTHYNAEDDTGETIDCIFNRYDFLEKNEFGKWEYNDAFEFDIDNAGASNEDKQNLLNMISMDYRDGLYGPLGEPSTLINFWKDRDRLGYPGAKRHVARWKRIQEEQAVNMPTNEPVEGGEESEM